MKNSFLCKFSMKVLCPYEQCINFQSILCAFSGFPKHIKKGGKESKKEEKSENTSNLAYMCVYVCACGEI